MKRILNGVGLILIFNILSAIYAVKTVSTLKEEAPSKNLLVTFGITAIFFVLINLGRMRSLTKLVRENYIYVLCLNFSTLLSWIGFVYALSWIGSAPVVDTALLTVPPIAAAFFPQLFNAGKLPSRSERISALGVLISLMVVILAIVNSDGFKKIQGSQWMLLDSTYWGLFIATIAGLGIAGNTVFSTQLKNRGLDASAIMAVRFWITICVALCILFSLEADKFNGTMSFSSYAILAITTVLLPLYVLQLGIQRCDPVTVNLLLPLAPLATLAVDLGGFFGHSPLPITTIAVTGIVCCVISILYGVLAGIKRQSDPQVLSNSQMDE